MVEVPGSESKLDCDLVLIAAGFLGTEDYIAKAFGVDLNARTNVATEAGHYKTNVENVSLQQEICIVDSPWLYGQSVKEEKQPVK